MTEGTPLWLPLLEDPPQWFVRMRSKSSWVVVGGVCLSACGWEAIASCSIGSATSVDGCVSLRYPANRSKSTRGHAKAHIRCLSAGRGGAAGGFALCAGESSRAMARDYDHLFKLLIIGDSGKETPRMRDGKQASARLERPEPLQMGYLCWI